MMQNPYSLFFANIDTLNSYGLHLEGHDNNFPRGESPEFEEV
jgi:hypothetical protein